MPSAKHEAAIDFAVRQLGGEWKRKGMRAQLRATLGDSLAGWIPDAFRLDEKTSTLEVIEAGQNSEAKWQAICEHWWFIDNAEWFLILHLINSETLAINTISDEQLASIVYSRMQAEYLKTHPAAKLKPFEEWRVLMGI